MTIPSVAILMIVRNSLNWHPPQGRRALVMVPPLHCGSCCPYVKRGVDLLAFHVGISNCFWFLVLPSCFHTCFCLGLDDRVFGSSALPYGRVLGPVIR